jgi:predicted outer membrane protein
VSDAEVAGMLHASYRAEMAQARAALSRTKASRVRDFAQQMVADQEQAASQMRMLAAKNSITPQESMRSEQIQQGSERALSSLRTADVSHVDETYIDAVVVEQKDLLTFLDTCLPRIENADLRDRVESVRRQIARQLRQALSIQADARAR